MLNDEQKTQLKEPLPVWAVKQHPTKTYLSVIDPMAVIDRLNEVFGLGEWHYKTENILFQEKFAVVKGTLTVDAHNIHLEQFGGNDNKDIGDAYKGASTDALTKIASYLGIGASIYKGQGNVAQKEEVKPVSEIEFGKLRNGYLKEKTMSPELREVWERCNAEQKKRINDVTKQIRAERDEANNNEK